MSDPLIAYDETSDTLSITFAAGEAATGIELTEHILLRVNRAKRRAVGVTIFDYSLITQLTPLGPRSFPATGLAQLPPDLRDDIVLMLRQPPVSHILVLSAYTPAGHETVPIISVLELATLTSST